MGLNHVAELKGRCWLNKPQDPRQDSHSVLSLHTTLTRQDNVCWRRYTGCLQEVPEPWWGVGSIIG